MRFKIFGGNPFERVFLKNSFVKILHEANPAQSIRDVCRQHSISEQTLFRWGHPRIAVAPF